MFTHTTSIATLIKCCRIPTLTAFKPELVLVSHSNMQESERRPVSNRSPILKFMSDFYVTDICTSVLCPFSKFTNRRQILKSMSFFQFSNLFFSLSYIDVQWRHLYPNPNPTINNKSAIDLRIWKGRRYEKSLKSDRDLR